MVFEQKETQTGWCSELTPLTDAELAIGAPRFLVAL